MFRHAVCATLAPPLSSAPLSSAPLSTLPKKPTANPYNVYISEHFAAAKANHPVNTPSKEILRTLSRSWSQLTAQQKTVYSRKASTRVQEYDNFYKTAPLSLLYQIEDKKDRKLVMKRFEELGRLPRKPPISGYNLFVSRQKRIPGNSPQDNIKCFANNYQLLSEVEKERLRQEVSQMKKIYDERMSQLLNK